jgi:natural product precursor
MKLKVLKLHQQNKGYLAKREMNFLKGGACKVCRCSCGNCNPNTLMGSMDAMKCSITGMGSADKEGSVGYYGCLDAGYGY